MLSIATSAPPLALAKINAPCKTARVCNARLAAVQLARMRYRFIAIGIHQDACALQPASVCGARLSAGIPKPRRHSTCALMKASTAMPLCLYRNNRARVYDRESRSASLCDIADQQHDKADMEGVQSRTPEIPQ